MICLREELFGEINRSKNRKLQLGILVLNCNFIYVGSEEKCNSSAKG